MTDYKQLLEQEIQALKTKVDQAQIPDELKLKVHKEIVALERSVSLGNYDEKYDKVSRYIEWVLKIPWNVETQDNLELPHTKEIFEKHHYGMQEVKDRFLEYVSVLKLKTTNQDSGQFRAPILLLVGLVGTGKTTFASSLAEALNRKLVRIPFGGMGSARELRGQSRLNLESEPGKVIKGLLLCGIKHFVTANYFDSGRSII